MDPERGSQLETLVKDKGVVREGKSEGSRRQTMVYEQKYNTGKMCGNRLRQKSEINNPEGVTL